MLLAAFCLMGWTSWKVARALGAPAWGFQPPVMAAAQHSPQDVIGDLGGMPVKISRFVAEYVEYEGDPGWSGPRKGPPPERTFASRLMSFGFEVRYPDMAMLNTKAMWDDKRSYNIYNTPWISVGITTGPHYPGRGFMNRPHVSNGQLKDSYWWNSYAELKPRRFGLTEYRLSGKDPRTGQPARDARDADVIYLYRDRTGEVTTQIICRNVPHEAAPCTQTWDMGRHGVDAEVRLLYRRGLMEHWHELQHKVTQVILGFRADSPNGVDDDFATKKKLSPTDFSHLQEK